ncbi:uncharacterized protein [Antedon mediterranea]|uniref:uncharacterized protein n=1 Tax=Antedon mediterranea TaxID=105859 RepID=UPI003AF90275
MTTSRPIISTTLNEYPECFHLENAADYRGTVSVTQSGRACQYWTSQSPHEHGYSDETHPNTGLGDHNYCRNPEPDEQTWCYTTDPDVRWEWCDVGQPNVNCASCSETFNGTEGRITSPSYPANYENDQQCEWTIHVPDAYVVQIAFVFFDVEFHARCTYDYLDVYTEGINDEQYDYRFCGTTASPVISEGSTLVLIFTSDNIYNNKGFDIRWKAIKLGLLSKFKPTKQSSAYADAHPYGSELAVDGHYSSRFEDGFCCHTDKDFEPWWRVDLEKAFAIRFVDIINRNSHTDRLVNTEVHVGMNPNPFNVNPQCGAAFTNAVAANMFIRVECGELLHGRYVSIYIPGVSQYLTLCEVQVYGLDIDNLPSGIEVEDNECSFSPGPCDDPSINCTILNADWPSCQCDETMFKCNNGRCVPMMYRCNMYDNCGDSTDEYSCECEMDSSVCLESNGTRCIVSRFVCDGFDNCEDSSDEHSCTCGKDDFVCSDGRCLASSKVCNNLPECQDEEDEGNCVTCDGAPVPFSQLCDGKYDCTNREDELNCAYCPSAYEQFKGSCYHFKLDVGLSFTDAQDYCSGKGGYLVVIDSEDENVYITQSMVDLTDKTYVWIGINDIEEEGIWVPEAPMFTSYTNWNPGQPDNYVNYDGEHCAHLQVQNGRGGWNDIPCSFNYMGTVCEFQPVRLVGGDSLIDGFVEIYNDGSWGTICSKDWGTVEADVVCNQLNLPYSDPLKCCDAKVQHNTGRHYDQVSCTGEESSLSYCSSKVEKGNCPNDLDVWVKCSNDGVRLVGGSTVTEGFVEVFKYGEWGSICDAYPTKLEATVICKGLGYSDASNYTNTASASSAGTGKPINIANPDCVGTEASIFDCNHSNNDDVSCLHDQDIFVFCSTECTEEIVVETKNLSFSDQVIYADVIMEPCTKLEWNIQGEDNYVDLKITEMNTEGGDEQQCTSYLLIKENNSEIGPVCNDVIPFVRSVSNNVSITLSAGYKRQYLHLLVTYMPNGK